MLPSGTVTFLFTDIQGSTAKWESDPDQMRVALEEHNAILEAVIAEHGGHVFKTVGDAFCAAFENASNAASAALEIHKRLASVRHPLTVRIGLHTDAIQPNAGDYFGQPVNRVARIQSSANGGQTIASGATTALLTSAIARKDLGEHSLKDLLEPMRLWQVGEGDFGPPHTLEVIRHNLPVQTTSFVGREHDIKELNGLLDKSRLITLTGTGGTGKSRLALQLAAESLDRFPDGVWFVELAPLPNREDVLREIASATGAPEITSSVTDQIIQNFLRRRACLILDNCEHVLDITSQIAERLVRSCPSLTVLATSREPLGASGEAVYRVPSLPLPEPGQAKSLRELENYGSTALFLERLSTAAPNYGLCDEDAPTIGKICARLDGIPLALELAAARGRAMRLDQVENRLDDRFRLLTGGSRNALSRQQTLQALIDWSVQLLNDDEKKLFTSLAVFAGSWDIDAAEAVCGSSSLDLEGWQILDLLTALVDKSLVLFDHGSGRYKMLESIRQYSNEQLAREPWAIALRNGHAHYFLKLADPGQGHVMVLPPDHQARFNREYENIRSALEWSLLDEGMAHEAVLVACNLWAGYLSVARSSQLAKLMEPLVSAAKPRMNEREYIWSHAILAAAYSRGGQDGGAEIMEGLRDKLVLLAPDDRWLATSIFGYTKFRAGLYQESVDALRPMIEELIDVVEDPDGYCWAVMGLSKACLGDFDSADADFIFALEKHNLHGDRRGWAACATNLAITHALRGQWKEALTHALAMNKTATQYRVLLPARGALLSLLGLIAFEHDQDDLGIILCTAEYGREEEADPLDPLDQMFVSLFRKTLQAHASAAELGPIVTITRNHDWEPLFQALVHCEINDILGPNGYQFPFPDLLPLLQVK